MNGNTEYQTCEEIYKSLVNYYMFCFNSQILQDKISYEDALRQSNIWAVQNTTKEWRNQFAKEDI